VSGRRAVLTGRGIVSPLGVGIDRHCDALAAGRSAVAALPRLRPLGTGSPRAAEIAPEVLAPHLGRLPRKQQKLYNRATLLGMLASSLAMEEAGLSPGAGDPSRLGVVLGVNVLSWALDAMAQYLAAAESREEPGTLDMAAANAFCMRGINPLDYSLKTLPNLAAGHLAITHDARGPCRALTEGSTGGAQAIGQAFRMIQEDDVDAVLCGGADSLLEDLLFASAYGSGLSEDDSGGVSGPVLGEGSGILILEDAEHAAARRAPVHAEVLGFATVSGAGRFYTEEPSEPLAVRVARVIEAAIAEAQGPPDLVCLHGDGLPVHDRAESAALARVLGTDAADLPTIRMKDAHGDLGAAGAPVEFLACSAALREGKMRSWISGLSAKPRYPSVSRQTETSHRALLISLGQFGECAALMLAGPGERDAG
jgi:3-oxoacyl-[acyl-carrier-protein] synthase II